MSTSTNEAPKAERAPGFIRRWWNRLRSPAKATALGVLLVIGFGVGILFWGGFHWSLELTNTENFCVSCHEMRTNVFAEYRNTTHYGNRSGVRASCPDCHVPKEWNYKIIRKIQASNELLHHLLGSVDTTDKFNDKRLTLALHEWERMKTTDSRECRNCHNFASMDYSAQEPRASKVHQEGLTANKTCIDCHQGVAHRLPPNAKEAYQKLTESLASGDRKQLSDYLESLAPSARASPVK